ncbi:hypothetical protein ACFYW1_03190 [Streptomyces sp. NPDC002669]|uniref:hypothetical protein n=1 Tax=Streptomyces sp. NPDC002669 TaxID=3364658 RepID=UPI0036780D46
MSRPFAGGGAGAEEPEITIKLTRDEATILSDWSERLQMTGLSNTVDDPVLK